MRTDEGLVQHASGTLGGLGDLTALTRLMALSCRVADLALKLYDDAPTLGMKMMEAADLISEEVGVWAERSGYTLDEVTQPLWNGAFPTTQ